MRKTDTGKNLQVILSYSLIVAASIMLIYALGFMTNFYRLFVDGTSQMYDFYKDLQILNNAIFNAAIICLLLSLGMIAFDVTKKRVGIFGTFYTFIVAIVTFVNTQNVLRVINYFKDLFSTMDFSSLEGYTASMFPFNFGTIIFICVTALTILVAIATLWNAGGKIREDKING